MDRRLSLLAVIGAAALCSACPSPKQAERAVMSTPAPPSPVQLPRPVAASPELEGGSAGDLGACGDLELLEPRVGDGALTKAEVACLRARLPRATSDSERYMVVHLLALDLDGKGYREDSAAVLRQQLPGVDCGKVEGRLRPACVAFKSGIR